MYNPFKNKQLVELTHDDIFSLLESEIGEGWYIEYKQDVPKLGSNKLDTIKIAKSISSFANTKGGWIFWGISCDNKNKPIAIDGICLTAYPDFDDQVAKIINSNISPQPFYHFKRIELDNGKSIFIIQVEESPTPPYITSQGVIYQRENNESKPIRDRYILEKLQEKTDEYYESIQRFTNFELGETRGQSESDQAYLELYLFPLPFDSYHFEDFYSSDFFKNVALRFYQNVDVSFDLGNDEQSVIPLNLGFNSIYSSERSLIIRPLNEKNLIYKSTTTELFSNGNLKFLMPIFTFDTKSIPKHYKDSKTIEYLLDKYSPYETVQQLSYLRSTALSSVPVTRRKDTDFVNHIQLIDGLELIFSMLVLISKYKAVLEDNKFDMDTQIGFRAKVINSWRKFVFFDGDDYLEKIKLYNLPVAPKNDIEIPSFTKGSAYKVKLIENETFFDISRLILNGIGLPDAHSINFSDIIKNGINRFETKM
jgi:hypothetical protein